MTNGQLVELQIEEGGTHFAASQENIKCSGGHRSSFTSFDNYTHADCDCSRFANEPKKAHPGWMILAQ